jgi:hypothetical protein
VNEWIKFDYLEKSTWPKMNQEVPVLCKLHHETRMIVARFIWDIKYPYWTVRAIEHVEIARILECLNGFSCEIHWMNLTEVPGD